MNNNTLLRLPLVERVFQVLFSLNAALLSFSIAFIAWPATSFPFVYMEVRIKQSLRIKQTDLITGYLAFSIATGLLTVAIWTVLYLYRLNRAKRNRHQDIFGGTLILLTPPVFWTYYYCRFGWPFGWPYRGAPFELAVVLLWAVLFVLGSCPLWVSGPLLAAHYTYWFLVPRRGFYPVSNSGAFVSPILGFLTALVWAFYFHAIFIKPRHTPTETDMG